MQFLGLKYSLELIDLSSSYSLKGSAVPGTGVYEVHGTIVIPDVKIPQEVTRDRRSLPSTSTTAAELLSVRV